MISISLTLEDVQPLIILPEKISTGEKVFKELEKLSAEVGIPKEIIADKGSDIRSGIDKFCELTSETVYLYDIKHLIANLLKAEFKDDSNWRSFIDFAATARKYMQQTTLFSLHVKAAARQLAVWLCCASYYPKNHCNSLIVTSISQGRKST